MKAGEEDRGIMVTNLVGRIGFDAAVDTVTPCYRVGDIADWAGE
jgi:hypothetical protein